MFDLRSKYISAFIVLLTLSSPTIASFGASDIIVIVNPKNTTGSISNDLVRKIYLGKVREFPGGPAVAPVDQEPDTEIKDRFTKGILEKSDKQLQTYWSVQIFTGKGTPPNAVATDQEVKAWVAKNPGGIGYIRKESLDSSVKMILQVP